MKYEDRKEKGAEVEKVVRPELKEWQLKKERRGVPVWLFLVMVILAMLGLVLNIRAKNELDRAVKVVQDWEFEYNMAMMELNHLCDEKDQILKEDEELFKILLRRIDANERFFGILQKEREYYRSIVSPDQLFPADAEITELLSTILGDDILPTPDNEPKNPESLEEDSDFPPTPRP